MPKPIFHAAAFPQDKYRFAIYVNTDRISGADVKSKTGCVAWCNLGYFDMAKYRPCGGLIVDGREIQPPEYHDWGVVIDGDGRISAGVPDGARTWCPAVPPMVKNGQRAAAARDFGRNGTTMIGFRADGTPVVLLALKGSGSATSAEAVAELQRLDCVTVLRYDGSWSTQGDLGGGLLRPAERRIVYTMLLIFKRQKEDKHMNNLKVMPYSLALAGDKVLGKNFRVREFACHDGTDTVFIADELVQLLQQIRDHYGKPVHINSGYRTETWNKAHNGAAQSQHKYGRAADIHIDGVTPAALAAYVETIMPSTGGIGVYKDFVHVDVRANRARWKK